MMTVRYCVIMFTLLNSLALPLPAIEFVLGKSLAALDCGP